MSYKIENLIGNFKLAEAPHWDEDTQSLYFVDVNDKSIHKYTPSINVHRTARLGLTNITLIIPVDGTSDKFLISYKNLLASIKWDGRNDKISGIETVAQLDNTESGSYIWCDGKVDPTGKLWAGAMVINSNGAFAEKSATLYNLEADGKIKRHFNSLTIPNGLIWNEKANKFYFIDSPTRRIEQFDYDCENTTITNRTRLFTFDDHYIPGAPDGMTIDTDGNLWIACFGGGRVIKIDPTKPETLLETIELPTEQVSSVAFGGRHLNELYVTTARVQFGPEPVPEGPEHGVLYRITGLGVNGLPGKKVKI